jgi:hypothetical protein
MNFHMDVQHCYEYVQEQIIFINKQDDLALAGSLSLPKSDKPLAAVVLVSGMGKNDRDLNFLGKKLFFDLSDYLARCGIIVLRYDKRGVGQSGGVFSLDLTSEDFARDASAALAYLQTRSEVDHAKIGLIGHSEGGLISVMLAAQASGDSEVPAFIVSLAGAVVTHVDGVAAQAGMQLKADGASDAFVEHDNHMRKKVLEVITQYTSNIAAPMAEAIVEQYLAELTDAEKAESAKLFFAITQQKYKQSIGLYDSPWFRYFLTANSAQFLQKITVPMLALNGSKDWIVASSLALPVIKNNCGATDLTLVELSDHNHWFQQCKTGAMAEYSTIQETISQETLQTIVQWINARFNC